MKFDPYSKRTHRDIRNRLAEEFMAILDGKTAAEGQIKAWAAPEYLHQEEFIADWQRKTISRYSEVLPALSPYGRAHALTQGLDLWRFSLVYEAAERLEDAWHHDDSPSREARKGLVQMAGACVHKKRGADEVARKLAAKGVARIREHGHKLEKTCFILFLLKRADRFGRNGEITWCL